MHPITLCILLHLRLRLTPAFDRAAADTALLIDRPKASWHAWITNRKHGILSPNIPGSSES